MKTYRFQSRKRAFTLIELLIIAALISLLSGIAIIEVRQLMAMSQRKAAHADLRTLSDSLTTAHMDLDMWANIGFLYESEAVLDVLAQGQYLPPNFSALSRPNTSLGIRSRSLRDKWNGPYYASARARSSFVGAYHAMMELPGMTGKTNWRDWPADPWGNPYVVYLLNLTGSNLNWINSPFDEPNFVAIVVSYGPNAVPGGNIDPAKDTAADLNSAVKFRLYDPVGNEGEPDFHYAMKSFSEIDSGNLFRALHNTKGWTEAGGSGLSYVGTTFPGIMDSDSDDIWLPLH